MDDTRNWQKHWKQGTSSLPCFLQINKTNDSPTGCNLQLGGKFPPATSKFNILLKEEKKP